MAYNSQGYDDSSYDTSATTSSGYSQATMAFSEGNHPETYVQMTQYPAVSTWQAYQEPSEPSSASYTQSQGSSAYDSTGYFPADANWAASDSSMTQTTPDSYGQPFLQATAPGADTYGNPANAYGYSFGDGQPNLMGGTNQAGYIARTASSAVEEALMSPTSSHRGKRKDSARRKSKHWPVSPGSASSGSATPSRTKLRSASRTSKNTHHNPPQTEEERKNRESHNQVEKQYRNRLNGHFESLLEALPEDMRPIENEEEGGAGGADSDRRVSKAEVLEMAKRYIHNLEHECFTLEGERDDLLKKVEEMHTLYGRCQGGETRDDKESRGGARMKR